MKRHKRYGRRTRSLPTDSDQSNPLVNLWIWRILMPLGGQKELIVNDGPLFCGFKEDAVARSIGLEHWIDAEDGSDSVKDLRSELRKLYKLHSQKPVKARMPGYMEHNLKRLNKSVGLSKVDTRIFEFAVMINHNGLLDDAGDLLGDLSTMKMYRVLSTILDIPEAEIRTSLSTRGMLKQSGLLSIEEGNNDLRRKLEVISDKFCESLIALDADPIDLLSDCVTPSSSATLKLQDYSHISEELAVLKPYLKNAIKNKLKGVNIFIHGAPGTGKTQLAKVLARHLRCQLFDISGEDDEGEPVTGKNRLRAYRIAQYFFFKRRNLLLFDEMEDVFSDDSSNSRSTAQSHKAWINRILEENPTPAV
ncbi:MAG: AAA family ATPase, partial [Pseudomonadales bacterium]